jgi:hypothetical protein
MQKQTRKKKESYLGEVLAYLDKQLCKVTA